MQVRGKGRLAVSRSTYCGLISSSTASGIALDINLILRHSAAQGMHRTCWRLHSSPLRVRAWLIGIDWRMPAMCCSSAVEQRHCTPDSGRPLPSSHHKPSGPFLASSCCV